MVFGKVSRALGAAVRLIGAKDLWVGVSSLRYGLALVTADISTSMRIQWLEVVAYR